MALQDALNLNSNLVVNGIRMKDSSISIGGKDPALTSGSLSVGIGNNANATSDFAVAIGVNSVGNGVNSICIGNTSGCNAKNNTIVLNATGVALPSLAPGVPGPANTGVYITNVNGTRVQVQGAAPGNKPDNAQDWYAVAYNTATNEFAYYAA